MAVISRRSALLGAASLPLVPTLFPQPATAAAEMKGASQPLFKRFSWGGFEITTLLAGTRPLEAPQGTFGMNVDEAAFRAASEAHFISPDLSQNFFTPTLVNTGAELILFDTGLSPEGITAALAEAGYAPEDVDKVVLTHMHGDHIGGMAGEAGETFANATYVTGSTEYDHWAGAGNEGFDAKVRPYAEKFTFLDEGGSPASGITMMAAPGHTPGHAIYTVESEGKVLALTADTANHYVWSLAYPDWEVRFDADKATAAASRRKVFGMIAAERMPFIGYHMPFPAVGFVETRGDGFGFVPVTYQLMG